MKDIGASGITKEELVLRLKDVATALEALDNEEHNAETNKITAALMKKELMGSKDKNVRMWTACCLAEAMRIYAPNAPFSNTELKAILNLFVSQLQYIAKMNTPNFKRYYALLDRLADSQVFALLGEFPSEGISEKLFRTLFESLVPGHSHKVQTLMLDIMTDVVHHSDAVPDEVLEIALGYLIKSAKRQSPVANHLAVSFFKQCGNSLNDAIYKFFDAVLGMGKSSESDLADDAFELIEVLHDINADMLLKVVPQLQDLLLIEDTPKRVQVTDLLGNMFSKPGSPLIAQHKSLWQAFMARQNDKEAKVRVVLSEHIASFLVHHADHQVTRTAIALVEDMTESVRIRAIAVVLEAATAQQKSIPDKVIEAVQGRRLDKKASVRAAVLIGIANMHHARTVHMEDWMFGEEACGKSNVKADKLATLVLRSFHIPDLANNSTKATVLKLFNGTIMNPSMAPAGRASRMVRIWCLCDGKDKSAFQHITLRQKKSQELLLKCVEAAETDDVEDVTALTEAIAIFCRPFSQDATKMKDVLTKTLTAKKAKDLDDLRCCCQPGNTLEDALAARNRLLKKVEEKPQAHEAFKIVLAWGGPYGIDTPTIAALCEQLPAMADAEGGKEGAQLLNKLAELCPEQFNDEEVLGLVVELLAEKTVLKHEFLKLLPHLSTVLREDHPKIASKVEKQVARLAINGPQSQAHLAVDTIMSISSKPATTLMPIAKAHAKRLVVGGENLCGALRVMTRIAQDAHSLFAKHYQEEVLTFVVEELLPHCGEPATDETEETPEWEEAESSECAAKVVGIELIVANMVGARARGAGEADTAETVREAGELHMAKLFQVLEKVGDMASQHGDMPAADCSRLRLAAAQGILNVARFQVYAPLVTTSRLQLLASMMQDSCIEVREGICSKIAAMTRARQLPLKFMNILVLGAADPIDTLRSNASKALAYAVDFRRKFIAQSEANLEKFVVPEYALPDLIHLLAHHEDFASDAVERFIPGRALTETQQEALAQTALYLNFFFDVICKKKSKNFDFLIILAQRMRQLEDKQTPDESDRMHVLCELTVRLINKRARSLGWTLSEHPGEVQMPTDLVGPSARGSYPLGTLYLPLEATIGGTLSVGSSSMMAIDSTAAVVAGGGSRPSTAGTSSTRKPLVVVNSSSTPKKKRKASGKGSSKQKKKAQPAAASTPEPSRRNARRGAKDKVSSFFEGDGSDVDEADAESDGRGSGEEDGGEGAGSAVWKPAMRPKTAQDSRRTSTVESRMTSTPAAEKEAMSSDEEHEEAEEKPRPTREGRKKGKQQPSNVKAKVKAKKATSKAKPKVVAKSKPAPKKRAAKRKSNEPVLSAGSDSEDSDVPVRVRRLRSASSM